MSWVGGKKALRDEILPRFPLDYKRYIEVFGGGGWVLFHKNPGKDFEIYNDFNGDLVNLYRCVREHPTELKDELTFVLNARLDFEYMKEVLHTKAVLPDVRRAAYFYALIRYSYASGTDSFGGQPHAMWRNFPVITAAAKRLQTVVIENRDFQKLIQQHDRPESFFYCDPPYVKHKNPIAKRRTVNPYTPEGRKEIHDSLGINLRLMWELMRSPLHGKNTEFADNRISLFSAQWGKCAITGKSFCSTSDIHCHHKTPKAKGGTDAFCNLILVLEPVHKLIHATEPSIISKYLQILDLSEKQLKKLNYLRTLLNIEKIAT